MKKQSLKFAMFAAVHISAVLLAVGCSKDGGGGGGASTPTTAYHINTQNGTCVDQNNNIVGQQYCTNSVGNSGYSYSNGNCVRVGTNEIVNPQFCQQNTGYGTGYGNGGYVQQPPYYGGGGMGANSCVGYYYYAQQSYFGMQAQMVYCSGYNCAGYTLQSLQTGQSVRCM